MAKPNLKVVLKDIYPLDTDGFLADLLILNLDTRQIVAQNVFELEVAGGYEMTAACLAATQAAIVTLINATYVEDYPEIDVVAGDVTLRTPDFYAFDTIPAIFSDTKQTTSGHATFYLTDDKTNTGNDLFSSIDLKAVQLTVHKKTVVCPAEAASITGHTLVIDVNKLVLSLGLLDVTQSAANGTDVAVLVHGVPA